MTVIHILRVCFSLEQDRAAEQSVSRADINRRAEEILDTHGNSILRYAYSYLHNMSDAEEVLQDKPPQVPHRAGYGMPPELGGALKSTFMSRRGRKRLRVVRHRY